MTVERNAGWTRRVLLVSAGLTLTLGCPAARTDYDYSKWRTQEYEDDGNAGAANEAGVAGMAGAATQAKGGAGPVEDASAPLGGSTGGTTTATPNTDAEAGALLPGAHDFDALQGCYSDACGASFAQIVDAATPGIGKEQCGCLMMGLRDRTPGFYKHNVVAQDSRGLSTVTHAFLVKKDGTVIHAAKTDVSGSFYDRNGTSGTTYTEAESCNLSPASYFDACLTAVNNASAKFAVEDPVWTCLYVEPVAGWLTGCTPVEAACE